MSFPNFCAIITAAGSSSRFNNGIETPIKKEYLKINEHTVLYNSVVPFLSIPNLQAIIITTPKDTKSDTLVALEELGDRCPVPLIFCDGGNTRQESVYNALKMLKTLNLPISFAAIHDGARCFVTPELIIRTLASANVFGGCAPVIPITDSIKEIGPDGIIKKHLDRRTIFGIQTPQIFKFPEILEAHENADEFKTYNDDTEIFSDYNLTVGACKGDINNIKITYLDDIPDAKNQIEEYIQAKKEGESKYSKDKEFRTYLNKIDKDN
ncbi:MAG: IspD/TarI family cytidylyltransferase [Pleomorphochaeta sp.]